MRKSIAQSFALASLLGGPLALVGCGGEPVIGDTGATASAQAVYASYQAGAKDRVQFTVNELDRGSLTALAGQPVNDLLGVPDYWLRMEQSGTEIVDLARTPRDPATSRSSAGRSVRAPTSSSASAWPSMARPPSTARCAYAGPRRASAPSWIRS
jgi:hypothetical protein